VGGRDGSNKKGKLDMVSRFGKGGAAPATQAASKPGPVAGRKSKYAGVHAAGQRTPSPWPGEYLLEILETTDDNGQGSNDTSYKVRAVIVNMADTENDKGEIVTDVNAHHKIGDEVFVLIGMTSGNGMRAGLERVKAFTIAAAGYEDEPSYDDFDPECVFLDYCGGTGRGSEDYPEAGVVGRQVACVVRKGEEKPTAPDGFYRVYAFAPAADPIERLA
jgi:hypothetical protein